MEKPIIVTSGQNFTDIDAYACAIAYNELLSLEGKNSRVVLPGKLNLSITKQILSWGIEFKIEPDFTDYNSVILDVSEPAQVAKCANIESIVEVYDHRYGYIDFWNEKLGDNSHIELVGACTTLIWEQFKKRGFSKKISKTSANLLYIGILSNTLNFGAKVTTQRDIDAYRELEDYIELPQNWKETYFKEQEESLVKNVIESIKSDTKILDIPNLDKPITMGQLELWDGSEFINQNISNINEALKSFNIEDFFMSVPSIKEKINYIYTESSLVKDILNKIMEIEFDGNIGRTKHLWLRKEIRAEMFKLFENI